jgi:ATP-binding cassette subfamily C protein
MLLFIENITIINEFGSLLILLIAGIMIIKGEFTIGLYTSFSLYIARVFASTQGVATIGTTIKPVCLSIERLHELLDMDDENTGRDGHIEGKIESIGLENISFKYEAEGKTVLDSLSFNVNKGEKVLLKGENGSGKSTLIKLLLGLYTPCAGKILYNGLDLNLINRADLRKRVGVVSQNIFIFKGTVLDNILYGVIGKERSDVEGIIKELNLEEYIGRLPKGLDTEIVQNTSGVSGGQAQVIAFIRAMLSNRDVIILDEPISNVDLETRGIILDILRERHFDGIVIVISHIIDGMDFINRIIEI